MKDFLAYARDPNQFTIDILNGIPYPWQAQANDDAVRMDRGLAVQSGAGCGKTTWLARLILWFVVTHPLAQVPCTAPSKHHLIDLLWSQISREVRNSPLLSEHLNVSQTKISMKGFEREWFAIARTGQVTPDGKVAEGLQGFHGPEGWTMLVADEASGIADQVMAATDGVLATGEALVVKCSNPIRTTGDFYDSCTKLELAPQYYRHKISCFDIPNVNRRYIDYMASKYGVHDPIYIAKVLGEFPNKAGGVLFEPDDLAAMATGRTITNDQAAREFGPLKISVDIADGGDCESVATLRRGRLLQKQIAFRAEDTEKNADQIELLIRAYNPFRVYIDAVGVGSGVYATLKRRGHGAITRAVKGNTEASDPELFLNLRCELYFHAARVVRNHQIECAFPNERLKDDLERHKQETKVGVFAITTKEKLRKTGKSPDYSDSWVMSYVDELEKSDMGSKTAAGVIKANESLIRVASNAEVSVFAGGQASRFSESRFSRWGD